MAGPWYVRSTNTSSGDGTSWVQAVKTLAEAFTFASAGDTIYVSQVHSEGQAAVLTVTGPGTAASWCKIICINDSTGALANTAYISTTLSYAINLYGFNYYYGIRFSCGSGVAFTGIYISSSQNPTGNFFENCSFNIGTASSSGLLSIGAISTSVDDQTTIFKNCNFSFSNASQVIALAGRISFFGGSIGTVGTVPTTLLKPLIAAFGQCSLNGVDLSVFGSTKNLVLASTTCSYNVLLSNCSIGNSVSVLSGNIQGRLEVYLDSCDSGDPSSGPRSEAYTYQGSVKTDTAKYRTDGASDGTPYSLMMTANTTGVSFISPLVTRPIPKVIDTVGSEVTVTAHIAMEEGSTPLTESKCWMEVEYMGTSGSTLTSFLTDNNSTVISESSTDQASSTETWTGFTGTPVTQKLSVAFTPQEKGFYMVRIYLARVSAKTTAPPVYVCPKLVVS